MTLGAKVTLAFWGAIIVWDLICPEHETVSEAVERGLKNPRTEPFVTLAILSTVAHLMRSVSERYDVYSIGFRWIRKVGKKHV